MSAAEIITALAKAIETVQAEQQLLAANKQAEQHVVRPPAILRARLT